MPDGSNGSMVRQIKVMISSTRADLMQYREAAVDVLNEMDQVWKDRYYFKPIAMETALQTGKREYPVEISKQWVEESDWVVLIVGWHYGTITDEEGANGLSVTEWEYKHALKLKKKIFVFVAGEDGLTDFYDGQGDTPLLLKWRNQKDECQRKSMEAFRTGLTKSVAAFFQNAAHFKEKLRPELYRAAVDLAPDLSHDKAFRELIARLLDTSIKPCFAGVKQLHRSKVVHDLIHQLRQDVLVPLRERVERKKKGQKADFSILLYKSNKLLGKLEGESDSITRAKESRGLIWAIGDLVREFEQLNSHDENDDEMPLDKFANQLEEKCFSVLEKAFDEANTAIQEKKEEFVQLHELMTDEFRAASRGKLPDKTKASLKKEIDTTVTNRTRLIETLEAHDCWQSAHRELVDTGSHNGGLAKRQKRVTAKVSGLPGTIETIKPWAKTDEEDISKLSEQFDELMDAQARFLALGEDSATNEQTGRWDDYCRAFDLCFFKVDKYALKVVERTNTRVEDLERAIKSAGID